MAVIRSFLVSPTRKCAWLWALKARQNWGLDELLIAGADEMVRKVAKERTDQGKTVPKWIHEYLNEHSQTNKVSGGSR